MHQAEWHPSLLTPAGKEKQTGAAMQGMKAALVYLGTRLPLAGGLLLLSLAQCLAVPSPYAICFLAALMGAGVKPKGAILGLSAGLLLRLLWGLSLDLWQFVSCLLCFLLLKNPPQKNAQLLALTGVLLFFRALPEILNAKTALTVILQAAGILIGLVLEPAFRRGAEIWKTKRWNLTVDDALCLCLPLLLMLSGAGRFMICTVNVGYLAAIYTVLLSAWQCGSALGAIAGVGCGMALLLGGQSPLALVNLVLGGVLTGMLQGKKRLHAGSVYLLSSVTVTYLTAHGFSLMNFSCGLAGCALFCLTPNAWLNKAGAFIRRLIWSVPRENAYMHLNMQRWVRAIDRLGDALPQPRMDTKHNGEDSAQLQAWLCGGCAKNPVCSLNEQTGFQLGFEELADLSASPDAALECINRRFSVCDRIGQIPALLERLEQERMERAQRVLCAAYERDMLQAHLTALSQAAQQISLEGMNEDSEEAYWLSQTEEALQELRFPGKAAFVKRVDGRMTVCLRYELLSLHSNAKEALEDQLGKKLRTTLKVTEQAGNRIVLEEPPPLCVVTGVATVSASPKENAEQLPDNGDAVLIRSLSRGRELLAISDGMGHGADAQAESGKTLELLSLCMEAGYTRMQAMMVVNGSMLSVTGGENFATVDLCLIDLWNGETAMNKLGACASFLIQGQKIKTIEGAALPLGIIEHVIPMEHRFSMGEGDTLVLVSDGVTDAFPHMEGLLNLLRKRRGCSPQRLADTILRAALEQWDGAPPDDMTVLCARVEEREKTA